MSEKPRYGGEWKPIPNYPGYLVNSDGYVLNKEGSQPLGPRLDTCGYPRVRLCHAGKSKDFKVHRLVASLFIPNSEGKGEVNHKDANKLNNHVSNLEWCTHRENMDHANRNDLIPYPKGESHGSAKLSEQDVLLIRDLLKESVPKSQIAKRFNVTPPLIGAIAKRRIWRHL